MALSAATVWEVQTGGSDTNGGGFVAGASGTDYSQQASKNTTGADISTTDAVANGTTTITSATANFGTTIVGNIVYFAGGTGSIAGVWRQVTARASSTSITIDLLIAASTGMTMNIGGALASPGQAGAIFVSSNTVWIKTGTYLITSPSTNIAGGCLSTTATVTVEGYAVTRGDLGTPPTLKASGISTAVLVNHVSQQSQFVNLAADGNNLTSIQGFALNGSGNQGLGAYLLAKNCTNTGINATRDNIFFCQATGCTTAGAGIIAQTAYGCESWGNTVTGMTQSGAQSSAGGFFNCLSYSNTGASSDGFLVNGMAVNCTAYGNGRDGVRLNGNGSFAVNCIAEGNTGRGFNYIINFSCVAGCATFSNTAGATLGTPGAANAVPLAYTVSAFVNAASANFALNTTAGGGVLLRGLGFGTYPRGLTTSFPDIGAAQHADPAFLRGGGMTGGMTG